MAEKLGVNRRNAVLASRSASCAEDIRRIRGCWNPGFKELEYDPDAFAVVIFGRSYNALVSEAHMGIPNKFASRGVRVIPLNALPRRKRSPRTTCTGPPVNEFSSAAQVRKHPQLFGCYITNFSCGPDSFLIGYFREVMGKKPSLTLELDSHVADAGLETRIEAFLDIIDRYRELEKGQTIDHSAPFRPPGSGSRRAMRFSIRKATSCPCSIRTFM